MTKDGDQQQASGSSIERTLVQLKQSMDSMHNKFDSFRQELTVVQTKVHDLESGQVELAGRLLGLEATSASKEELTSCQTDLKEELDKIRKASNLMMFGVDETEGGMMIAGSLLRLLLPHRTDNYVMYRQNTKSTNKPRPLKVLLNNPGERSLALTNKKLMKGIAEYKAISVQPDRTKIQRTASAEKYSQRLKDQGVPGSDNTNGRVLRSQEKRSADQMNAGTREFLRLNLKAKFPRMDPLFKELKIRTWRRLTD